MKKPPPSSKGKKSVKHGSTEYWSVHVWLRKEFGPAARCEGADCTGKSLNFQWALKKGCDYAKLRENFLELCASCHAKYDTTPAGRRRMSEFRRGRQRPYLWKPVQASKENRSIQFESNTACANYFKVRTSRVGNCLARSHRLKGFTITYQLKDDK